MLIGRVYCSGGRNGISHPAVIHSCYTEKTLANKSLKLAPLNLGVRLKKSTNILYFKEIQSTT